MVLMPAVLRALMARGFRQSNATGLHLKAGLSVCKDALEK
jgi:hypothetical protein